MNAGAGRLKKGGWSLAAVVTEFGKAGRTVTRTTVRRWRDAEKLPGPASRAVLAAAPFCIPIASWDRAPAARGGLEKAPASSSARIAPDVVAPGRAENQGSTIVAGEVLARDFLDRVTSWRKAAEESGSDVSRVRFAQLERQAIALYLAATGKATATEPEIGRSPQWVRLRGEILAALERHPEASKAVLAVMDRHAPPAEGTAA